MAKTDKPEKNENKKSQKHFWKDFKAELKKVIWPTRSQVINNTIIVIVIVLIVTAICFVLDFVFEAMNKYGIDKLKSAVLNSVSSEESNNNEVNSDNENIVDTENNIQTNEIANEIIDETENANNSENNEANS